MRPGADDDDGFVCDQPGAEVAGDRLVEEGLLLVELDGML